MGDCTTYVEEWTGLHVDSRDCCPVASRARLSQSFTCSGLCFLVGGTSSDSLLRAVVAATRVPSSVARNYSLRSHQAGTAVEKHGDCLLPKRNESRFRSRLWSVEGAGGEGREGAFSNAASTCCLISSSKNRYAHATLTFLHRSNQHKHWEFVAEACESRTQTPY